MGRFAIMQRAIKRVHASIAGIAILLCLDAALVALGWIATREGALTDGPAVGENWTPPDFDTLPMAAGQPIQDNPVLTRPIFFTSRKPFEPPPAREAASPPTVSAPPPSDPILLVDGIVLTSRSRKAHVRRPAEVDGRWHEAGQVIDGWTIVEIDAVGILLEQSGRRVPVRLYPTEPRAFRTGRLSPRPGNLR